MSTTPLARSAQHASSALVGQIEATLACLDSVERGATAVHDLAGVSEADRSHVLAKLATARKALLDVSGDLAAVA